MGYFQDPPTKRVNLPDNEKYWVELATEFKYGDVKKFANLRTDGQVDVTTASDTFLLAAIKAWNLDDAEGNVMPIDPEHIDLLSQSDAVFLVNEANGLISDEDPKKK